MHQEVKVAGGGKFGALRGMLDKVLKPFVGSIGGDQTHVVEQKQKKVQVKKVGKPKGSPPIFHGNSKQRRKARRAWERKHHLQPPSTLKG